MFTAPPPFTILTAYLSVQKRRSARMPAGATVIGYCRISIVTIIARACLTQQRAEERLRCRPGFRAFRHV
jgi:hypothetical protein